MLEHELRKMEWFSFARCGEESQNRVRTAAGTGCVGIRLLSIKGWQELRKQVGGRFPKNLRILEATPALLIGCSHLGDSEEKNFPVSLSKKVAVSAKTCIPTLTDSAGFLGLLHSPNLLSLILKEQAPTYTSHLGDSGWNENDATIRPTPQRLRADYMVF